MNADTFHKQINHYEVWMAFKAWIIMFFVLNLIALYLDNVLPKEHGIRQPFYFFLKPRWWCRNSRNTHNNDDNQERLIENESMESIASNRDFEAISPKLKELEKLQNYMKVTKLTKVYDKKNIIEDVTLNMYSGQIFVLLGHNGAGKSTILSILAGNTPNSGGTATCFGIDMFKDIGQLRRNLGVCPQFDILFDYLTPREHLKLSCMFKGVNRSKWNEQIERTLEDIGLLSKGDAFSYTLSGGEK